jgi:hypothetical protein
LNLRIWCFEFVSDFAKAGFLNLPPRAGRRLSVTSTQETRLLRRLKSRVSESSTSGKAAFVGDFNARNPASEEAACSYISN